MAMTLKPWRLIAQPHLDVLQGTFKQAEFAADISLVAEGAAEPEYQDAAQFFKRTYITEGMRNLLISVAQRLAGKGGDPVIQLQTNFGGGKTHTLLAVYHMARQDVPLQRMEGIPTLLDEAGIMELPKARVAIVDGIALSPNQPVVRDGLEIRTLWGLIAHALLGKEGYERVKDSDLSGTAPGKRILVELLREAAPCVVLMDETVAFLRQLDDSKQLTAGTLAANMSFIQALTEGIKAVPNAILLASLPESDTEVIGSQGLKTLASLEKYFGRVESVWKPVAQDESFEIVRRRLFDNTGNEADVDEVCRAFERYYRENKKRLPAEVQESRYHDKLKRSYPIHPEVFDRLYEDWSTLEKFQRTRGVLQYMAIVIHRLWQDNDQDLMIMPGSLPLHDAQVQVKSTLYLPQGWDAVINGEIDGPDSQSAEIDKEPRFGSIQAAHRVARTIFLGSAPFHTDQAARGMLKERILLGCARPGDEISIYEDVFKRMRDRLHYMFCTGERYWFDTHPNLRREMESRKEKVDQALIFSTLKAEMERRMGKTTFFCAQHVFTPARDIPDELSAGIRLVLLPPDAVHSYSKSSASHTFSRINAILGSGDISDGNMLEVKQRLYKNRLVFLAPDAGVVTRLLDQCRSYLAWREIGQDAKRGLLNLDMQQGKNVEQEEEIAHQHLGNVLIECYKHLIVPTAENERTMRLDVRTISCRGSKLVDIVRKALLDNEFVVQEYSPRLLKQSLDLYYFGKGQTEISVNQLWKDMGRYYYFQRLESFDVLKETIAQGAASGDYIGYADGKEGDDYLGFVFGARPSKIFTDPESLIIEKGAAQAYQRKLEAEKPAPPSPEDPTHTDGDEAPPEAGEHVQTPPPPSGHVGSTPSIKRYFGRVKLDRINPESKFHDVVTELISLLSMRVDVDINIRVEIEASAKNDKALDSSLIRAVRENANALGFEDNDFYEE